MRNSPEAANYQETLNKTPAQGIYESEYPKMVRPASGESTAGLSLAPARVSHRLPGLSELEDKIISLFDELRNRLLRYILSFGLSRDDGEEIVQEAFLSLFRHLQQGRPRHNLRGWLFRVAHNQALKRLSGNERRLVIAGTDMNTEIHVDPSPNPEEHLAFSQRQSRLLAVLHALPVQDQHCLRLRAEGLNYREIADVLGMSLGSISASLARSLARLGRADER